MGAQARAQKSCGGVDEADAAVTTDTTPAKASLPPGCVVAACDWLQEARTPALPERAFNIAIVCDCLYENKDSWDALEAVVNRVLLPGAELILASATLRRPFLEEFSNRLRQTGYDLVSDQITEHARVVALTLPRAGVEDTSTSDLKQGSSATGSAVPDT